MSLPLAAIWTKDVMQAHRVAENLEVSLLAYIPRLSTYIAPMTCCEFTGWYNMDQ